MLAEYLVLFYWTVAALGAALFLGTAAAYLRLRRTGALPGEDADTVTRTRGTPPGRRIVMRCALGLALVSVGAAGAAGVL